MQLNQNDIALIQNYFTGKPVLRAYLFGSNARNEAQDDSDIDILVDLDYTKHIGLSFVQMHIDLEDKLNKKIDLVSSNSLSEYIQPFVESDKILIYER